MNRCFARHPDFVLGDHALTSGSFGETYTCQPRPGADLATALAAAILSLPEALYDGEPELIDADEDADVTEPVHVGTVADGATIREGSYLVDIRHGLMQIVDCSLSPFPRAGAEAATACRKSSSGSSGS